MPFEDELGEALRRAGDGFTTDRHALVNAGEQRGRRLVARRRAAVVGGSVLALAVIGAGSAYTGGLFDGTGSSPMQVAAPPTLAPTPAPRANRTGSGAVSADQLIGVLKQLLPDGKTSEAQARGTGDVLGPTVSAVYDDGQGKAAIGVGLSRVDPAGRAAADLLKCPDRNLDDHDDCGSETLPDGSRILVYQGYEYPDRREPTKLWRATLVTKEGFRVDVQEWNAPAEKGAKVSRPQPPLTPAQLKTFATSPLWHPALGDLPAAEQASAARPPAAPDAAAVLESLLPKTGITVDSKGGEGEYGYVVLDDGKGKSLVQVNVQTGMGPALQGYFTGPGATTLPDGTKMKTEEKPGEKGGANVVSWSVDTLRPDGRRVVVSAYNTGNQNKAATRDEPILTTEQLGRIALDAKWHG